MFFNVKTLLQDLNFICINVNCLFLFQKKDLCSSSLVVFQSNSFFKIAYSEKYISCFLEVIFFNKVIPYLSVEEFLIPVSILMPIKKFVFVKVKLRESSRNIVCLFRCKIGSVSKEKTGDVIVKCLSNAICCSVSIYRDSTFLNSFLN